MARVIAVQEVQLKMLKENYEKNAPIVSVPSNNADMINVESNVVNPVVSTMPQIDMESEVVNLNSQNFQNEQAVTNIDATNEVFGSQSVEPVKNDVLNSSTVVELSKPNSDETQNLNSSMNFEVPYKEPTVTNNIPVNVMSDDAYYELLNSLRNMITDFANNAYSAIDKFQEERLQGKTTGANLVTNLEQKNEDVVLKTPENSVSTNDVIPNIFDKQSSEDLDKTVVLPANFIAENIVESENEFKMSA